MFDSGTVVAVKTTNLERVLFATATMYGIDTGQSSPKARTQNTAARQRLNECDGFEADRGCKAANNVSAASVHRSASKCKSVESVLVRWNLRICHAHAYRYVCVLDQETKSKWTIVAKSSANITQASCRQRCESFRLTKGVSDDFCCFFNRGACVQQGALFVVNST